MMLTFILVFSVKGDTIKMSLDYLQSNDYEMASNVLGSINMVKDITIHSDKCTMREIQKCSEEFAKELATKRFKSKIKSQYLATLQLWPGVLLVLQWMLARTPRTSFRS